MNKLRIFIYLLENIKLSPLFIRNCKTMCVVFFYSIILHHLRVHFKLSVVHICARNLI